MYMYMNIYTRKLRRAEKHKLGSREVAASIIIAGMCGENTTVYMFAFYYSSSSFFAPYLLQHFILFILCNTTYCS